LNPRIGRFLGRLATAFAMLTIALLAAWGLLALWYQLPSGRAIAVLGVALWSLFSAGVLVVLWRGHTVSGLVAFAAAFAALLIWWNQLEPSNQRLWADDVARQLTGTVDGDRVRLQNVRDFDWRSDEDYTQRWTTRQVDLAHLKSVDLIMSYWSGPAIAHMLVSFGFDDADYLVFSVEVRNRRDQGFSEVGGFFKDFALSIVAADERDVIRVRTNVRGEDDYLYRIHMPNSAMRALFLAYVAEANDLVQRPRFYNTITANCTTLVYHMMKHIVGYLPWDFRLLLTGYLPQYIYEIGGLVPNHSFEDLRTRGRITARARAADRSQSFSADIRRGVPIDDGTGAPARSALNQGVISW
jgi:hypothetical protein